MPFSILLTEASYTPTDDFPYYNSYFGSNMVKYLKEKVTITSNRQGQTTPATLYLGY